MRTGLLDIVVGWILEKVVDRVVKDPLAAGEFEEIEGEDYQGEETREISFMVTRDGFRGWVAEVDGKLDRPFRGGQRTLLMTRLAETAGSESLHATVKCRGIGSTLQVTTHGHDDLLFLKISGTGPAIMLCEECLKGKTVESDSQFELLEVTVGQEEYRKLLNLRFRELRMPLGLSWSVDDLKWEQLERHFGFYYRKELLGVTVVRDLGGDRAKLRQIVVESNSQGEGYGRRMLAGVIAQLIDDGVTELEIHSRKDVVGFYEKLGFKGKGPEFEEIGIPHRKMTRSLPPKDEFIQEVAPS